jgi:hypothetical protein
LPLEVTAGGGSGVLPLAVPRRGTGVRRKPRRSQQVLASGLAFMKALVRLSVFAVKFLVSPPRLVVQILFCGFIVSSKGFRAGHRFEV